MSLSAALNELMSIIKRINTVRHEERSQRQNTGSVHIIFSEAVKCTFSVRSRQFTLILRTSWNIEISFTMHSYASSYLFHETATAYFKYKCARQGLHANTFKYFVYSLKQILAKPLSFSLTENSSSHVFITQLLPTDHWQAIIRNWKRR